MIDVLDREIQFWFSARPVGVSGSSDARCFPQQKCNRLLDCEQISLIPEYHSIDSKSGQDGWLLAFGKLDFGRKAAKLRIRRGSSAVSFQLSCSSSLAAPDLTLSTFRLRQTPAALTSIGLKASCREATDTPAVLKSLTQAREQPSSKPPCFKHARLPIDMPPFRFSFAPADHGGLELTPTISTLTLPSRFCLRFPSSSAAVPATE